MWKSKHERIGKKQTLNEAVRGRALPDTTAFQKTIIKIVFAGRGWTDGQGEQSRNSETAPSACGNLVYHKGHIPNHWGQDGFLKVGVGSTG